MGYLVVYCGSSPMGNILRVLTWRQTAIPAKHPSLHITAQSIQRQTRVKRRRIHDDHDGSLKARRLEPACKLTYEDIPQPKAAAAPVVVAPILPPDIPCQCLKLSSKLCGRRPCQVRIANNFMSCKAIRMHLSPGQWLTSEIVNSYLHLLCSTSGPFAAASSFMLTSLMSANGGVGVRRHRWTKYIDWNKTKLLLIPIHLESRAHWLLAVVNASKRLILELDPLPPRGYSVPGYLLCLQEYMRQEMSMKMGDDRGWTIQTWPSKVPRQINGDDCGVFVCEFARRIVDRQDVSSIDPRRMQQVRSRICRELLAVRLEDR